jgi:hypothetical protein
MNIGTRVILTAPDLAGLAGAIVARYASPFGASWLVALDRGDTVAVRAVDLRPDVKPTPLCMHCMREGLAGDVLATDDASNWRPKVAGEQCGADDCGWWSYPDVNTLARRVALHIANLAAEEAGAGVQIDVSEPSAADLIDWIHWQDRNADVDGLTLAGLVAVVVGTIRDNIEDMTPDEPSRLSVSSDVTRMTIGALDVD